MEVGRYNLEFAHTGQLFCYGRRRGPFVGFFELVVVETHAHSVDLSILDN